MKRMLTTEQIKKAENNCGTLYSGAGVPANEMPRLFVPFRKEAQYYASNKQLDLYIHIDFTDCLPGYRYFLDWYNTPYDEDLKEMYPEAETWAEAINQWRDIETVKLHVYVYGLKSGIEFEMPVSLFVIEENQLFNYGMYLRSKDEDKKANVPINIKYNEVEDRTECNMFTDVIDGGWRGSGIEITHDLWYRLKAVGPVVDTSWGW